MTRRWTRRARSSPCSRFFSTSGPSARRRRSPATPRGKDEWCRFCEVDYGIHPIFRRHPRSRRQRGRFSRDGTVSAITAEGRLICSRHGKDLNFTGAQVASRTGLYAGKTRRIRLPGARHL